MAEEKENFLETLFRIGAFVGGAWITVELIRAFLPTSYICSHCDKKVPKGISECPYCQVKLKWKI